MGTTPKRKAMMTQEEIAGLKKDVEYIGKNVDVMMTNHIPHVQTSVDTLAKTNYREHGTINTRINRLMFWLVMLLAGIIVSIWLQPLLSTRI